MLTLQEEAFYLDWLGHLHFQCLLPRVPEVSIAVAIQVAIGQWWQQYFPLHSTLKQSQLLPLFFLPSWLLWYTPSWKLSNHHTCPVLSTYYSHYKLLFSISFPLMKVRNRRWRSIHLFSRYWTSVFMFQAPCKGQGYSNKQGRQRLEPSDAYLPAIKDSCQVSKYTTQLWIGMRDNNKTNWVMK